MGIRPAFAVTVLFLGITFGSALGHTSDPECISFLSPAYRTSPAMREKLNSSLEDLNARYYDRRTELTKRLKDHEAHFSALIALGAKEIGSARKRTIQLPPFLSLIYNYNARLDELVTHGIFEEKDLIRPAMPFVRKQGKKELVFIRPGYDSFPDLKEWELVTAGIELNLKEWTAALADGKALFQLEMADHDLAHLTEYLTHPEKMREVRRFYRRLQAGEIQISESSGPKFVNQLTKNTSNPRGRRYARLFAIEEALSLPDLSRIDELKKLVPEISEIATVPTSEFFTKKLIVAYPAPMNLAKYLKEFSLKAQPLLLRVGGGMRDTVNLERYGYRDLIVPKPDEFFAQKAFDEYPLSSRNGVIFSDSLHGRTMELQRLGDILASPKWNGLKKGVQAKVIEYARHRLVQFKLAIDASIRTGITSEVLMKELADDVSGPGTTSYRYFSAFSARGEFSHWAFVDKAK